MRGGYGDGQVSNGLKSVKTALENNKKKQSETKKTTAPMVKIIVHYCIVISKNSDIFGG